jgi:hypothetical protein
MEAAVDWLRKKGLSAAAKKSGRVAAEGLVAVASAPRTAAMVEINAETDFVARNEHFQAFCASVAELVLTVGDDIEALKAARYPGSMDLVEGGTAFRTVGEQLTHLIATIGDGDGSIFSDIFAASAAGASDATAVHAFDGPGAASTSIDGHDEIHSPSRSRAAARIRATSRSAWSSCCRVTVPGFPMISPGTTSTVSATLFTSASLS